MSGYQAGQCCGAPGSVTGGPPPSAAWDGMKGWYTEKMSPATATLALTLLSHLNVLDVGPAQALRVIETHCGDARAAAQVLPVANVEYTACDFSEGMLSIATERLGSKASTVKTDSTDLPFENASFDRYMSNLGGCCVQDFPRKLKEARRILAPGGKVAMSMRIGNMEDDTAFQLVATVLKPFGFLPQPDREGLRIGKDLPALKSRLQEAGFSSPKAWRTWISIPISGTEDFVQWATTQPPVMKLLASLDDGRRREALAALEAAGNRPAEEGALQVAVAVAVAEVPSASQ